MRAVSLLYHDVVLPGAFDASGFPGADADSYKMTVHDFTQHVAAVAAAVRPAAASVTALLGPAAPARPVFITFDDGGLSAHGYIADILERAGWRGHFLVTTDYIDAPAFLTRAQIRDLAARGHTIGSHSCSHPTRMAACTTEQLAAEWSGSVGALADVMGAPVTVASVPGGYYSRAVASAASAAGIRVLFNSEPTTRSQRVGECLVLGRYGFRRNTPPTVAARIARGDALPRARQWLLWNGKKVAKRAAGTLYLRARRAFYQGGAASTRPAA